jgi:hypothetical protein
MEITETRIFQTDSAGSVRFLESELGHKMWSIAAIYPSPVTEPTGTPIPTPPGQFLRPDLEFVASGPDHTRRITLEQTAKAQNNRFMPGNEVTASGPRAMFAYYLTTDRARILPLSQTAERVVGVSYLRTIDPVQTINDTIPYPDRAFQLLVDLALSEIAGRQGPETLYARSLQQVRTLLFSQA